MRKQRLDVPMRLNTDRLVVRKYEEGDGRAMRCCEQSFLRTALSQDPPSAGRQDRFLPSWYMDELNLGIPSLQIADESV